jgi:branched-chain amino acid transport system ATP-binding protein
MEALLELEHVSKRYGSLRVADDLSLQVAPGEALGVVGPNGAGKTTLMNLIAGTVPLERGRILFGGDDVTGMPSHVRCRAGIGRTHQIPLPFEGITVFENVLVGLRFGRAEPDPDPYGTAMSLLEKVDLADRANAPAGSLTFLHRKRLELARALATDPKLLLLDEIAGGLTEAEIGALVETIEELRAAGMTIVWIEHIVHALLSLVDRLMAMDFGKILKVGKPDEVMASREVQAVYMGVEVEAE